MSEPKVLDQDKSEVQKQWNSNPCGAETVKDQELGTLEFYRAARKHRYEEYGPWFKNVIRFDQYRGKKILEIGVGLGSDHHSFASQGNQMFALDLSTEHLRNTVRHLQHEGLSTHPQLGDAERMPFADNTFDVVYTFGVLHHTPNTEKSIAEVLRVLKPGGTAIVGLYHRDSAFYWIFTMLVNGLLHRGLFKNGYRKHLSQIEYRKDSDSAMPLVKVYSRRQTRKLFSRFKSTELKVCHMDRSQLSYFGFPFKSFSRATWEKWFGWMGWYVIAFARK